MTTVPVTLTFSLSDKGQRAALEAGLPAQRSQSLDASLPVDLLHLCTVDANGRASLSMLQDLQPAAGFDVPLRAEDAAAVVARCVEDREARRVATQRANAVVIDAACSALASDVDGWFARFDGKNIGVPMVLYALQEQKRIVVPGAVLWHQLEWPAGFLQSIGWTERQERHEAEKQARVERAAAERTARTEAAAAALRAWAHEHGSERLRLMLDLHVGEWTAVAEQEYVGLVAPEGYTIEAYAAYRKNSERKRPSLSELRELAAVRQLVDGRAGFDEPRLMWAEEAREPGSDDEAEKYPVIEIDIRTPNDAVYTVARRLVAG